MTKPTLIEFLLARIAEDEAVACGAIADGEGSQDWADEGAPTDEHIARWDPARVLVECDSKRAIVEYHAAGESECPRCWWDDMCPTLKFLTIPYVDHPDYLPGWRP